MVLRALRSPEALSQKEANEVDKVSPYASERDSQASSGPPSADGSL